MESEMNEAPNNEAIVTFIEETPDKCRKRKKHPEKWKRNIEKKSRHCPKGFPEIPTCKHKENNGFRCSELSIQDVRKIHQRYYKDADLQSKKQYILQHVVVSSAKRSRLPEGSNSRRQVSTSFFLPKQRDGKTCNIKVCRGAVLQILKESRNRLQNLCQKYLESGTTPCETRGGARQQEKYESKREAVKRFIKTFVPLQNHYCRGKNIVRQYLHSELNIKKMWEMYTEKNHSHDLHVEYEFFRNIFNGDFNIGFAAPYTDICSTCTRLECELATEKDKRKRDKIMMELKAHKIRAETFFELLREKKDNEFILSYDCQKNLILPKIPDQAAYYKRQLYLYNFVICKGESKTSQNKTNTFAYLWTENEFAKGSIQISSALYHRLKNSNLDGITTVKLFSDGCGGQNKNRTIVGMLSRWLLQDAPVTVKNIILYFPIIGHSFIPPDRVFGNLERQFQAMSVISNPEEYVKVIAKHCTISQLGKDCPVRDWKTSTESVLKPPGQWHFQFQKAKKIIFSRSKSGKSAMIQGESQYRSEMGVPKSLMKKGCSFPNTIIPLVSVGVTVKAAKLDDVLCLLTLHYGNQWQEDPKLKFYKDLFLQPNQSPLNEENEDEQVYDFELNPEDDPVI